MLDRLLKLLVVVDELYLLGHFSFELLPSKIDLRLTFLLVQVADMLMAADFTLLERSVEDVDSLVMLLLEVIFDDLVLNRVTVLKYEGVLDCSKFLLNFDAVEAHRVIFIARRKGHLFTAVA